ncbi:MAG: hypothetical protein N3A38_02080 [Planctomycetota bacterium]|nr:hypothetical protein [Planctomycetota bacterium]
MDTVRKYLFWIALGAIVAVSLAAYLLTVPPKWSANEELLSECRSMDGKISEAARDPASLPNQRYCDEAVRRRNVLNEQSEKVRRLWENRAVNVKEYTEGPDKAPEEPFPFVDWYEKKKKAIQEEAAKQGLLFPRPKETGAGRGDYGDDGFLKPDARLTKSAIPQTLKRLLVVQETYRAIGTVKVPAWDPKLPSTDEERMPGAPEMADQDKKAGVSELLFLRFVSEQDWAARRKAALGEALRLAKVSSQPPEDDVQNPYSAFGVEIGMLVHAAAVNRVLQALEGNEKFFAVVRRLDVQRAADPEFVPFGERFGVDPRTGKPSAEVAGSRHWYNDRYEEPPVFLFVEMEILEFPADISTAGDFTPKISRAKAAPAKKPGGTSGAKAVGGKKK